MKTFQYQVLRYLPDRVSGEFINLGVVVYQPLTKELKAQFYTKTNRLHAFFPSVNTRFISKTIKSIDNFLKKTATYYSETMFDDAPSSVEEITAKILPKDDSALFFTGTEKILDLNADSVLNDLFGRLVAKYVQETDHDTLADKEVWRQLYKSYFDKYELTTKLHPATIKTKMDKWNFERTFQNGALHCFESVSFDLSNDDTIRKKVYTWAGRIAELKTASSAVHLYLLTAMPEKRELKKFIKEKLEEHDIENTVVEIVEPSKGEKLAKQLKTLAEEH
jgi:hypothetical protein